MFAQRVSKWILLAALCGWLMVALPVANAPIHAQDSSDGCLAIVEAALATVEESCGGLGRNDACYGYSRVDALFWTTRDDLFFSTPADQVPLVELQSVATTPLDPVTGSWGVAVLHLQADLPDTLPGQAVMFLLMGDTTLENMVSPDEAVEPVTPVAVTTTVAANLRSRPTTVSNVIGSVPAGTVLQAVGVNAVGDWYEILLESGDKGWIAGTLVMTDDTETRTTLPVTYGEGIGPRYGPAQAFRFNTGLGGVTCLDAPNALVVQSPEGIEITFNINGLDVRIGSTVVFTTLPIQTDEGPVIALVVTLVEGEVHVSVNGVLIRLTRPGQSFAVTLNGEGLVDANSELIDLPDDRDGDAIVLKACENAAALTSLFPSLNVEQCTQAADLAFYVPPPPDSGHSGNGSGDGASDQNSESVREPTTCQWPVITYPPSGINVTGTNAHHIVDFTPVPNVGYYVWHIEGDGHDYTVSGATTEPSFLFSVGDLPTGVGGRGYYVWVTPYHADGTPMCPEERSPNAIWISKDLGAPPPLIVLPPEVLLSDEDERSGPVCGNHRVEEGEECDPHDGVTCSRSCLFLTPLEPVFCAECQQE
jgi:hypothetical protein